MVDIIYTRKSRPKMIKVNGKYVEEEDPLSHRMQFEEAKKRMDIIDALHFSDTGVSRDDRIWKWPKLNEAINKAKGGDRFIVYRSDRLPANHMDIAEMILKFKKKNVEFISVCDPTFFHEGPEYKFARNIVISANLFEVEKIRARVTDCHQTKKNNGEIVGYIPYGFTSLDGKYIIPCEEEQKVIDIMNDLYFNQGKTYREVKDLLEELGIRNRKGCPWSLSAVHRIIKRSPQHRQFYSELYQRKQISA